MRAKAQATKAEVERLQGEVEATLAALCKLSDQDKGRKNEDIKSMILYYNSMTDRIEDRRIRVYNLSLHVLAISVAGLTLIGGQHQSLLAWRLGRSLFVAMSTSAVLLIVASLMTAIVYQFQSYYRYPFLTLGKYGNRWKWFYYGNQEICGISANPIASRWRLDKTIVPYLAGLQRMVANYVSEDLDAELRDNILQLYLLQVHNYYNNLSTQHT